MVEKLTKAQAGSLGGKKNWARVSKKKRSARMKELAVARWAKKELTKIRNERGFVKP